MNFLEEINVYIRTALYLLIAADLLFLSQLYWYGYRKVKKSKIILVLQRLLTTLGVFFLVTAFLPIVRSLDYQFYQRMVFLYPILLLPLWHYIRRFRKESINDQEVTLPKDTKVKKKELTNV